MKIKALSFLCFILFTLGLNSQNEMVECNNLLIQTIMEDNFSPPVASRVHLYANLASYEVFSVKKIGLKSISKFTNFPRIPRPEKKIDDRVAATFAFIHTAIKFTYTETKLKMYLQDKVIDWVKNIDTNVLKNSKEYGEKISNLVYEWSKTDQYSQIKAMHRFEISDSNGAWKPTPPEYMNGLEPNWNKMRQITLPKDSFVYCAPNILYSEERNSIYYKNALELYHAASNITESQKLTVEFWDDNPMTTISTGHITYIMKKPTPMGHWFKIIGQILNERKESVENSSQLYMMAAIAGYDGFINCWNTKYKTNALRPETYIQKIIDPNFEPVIETPPFPEYTSGHATISFAIASVLTTYYPDQTGFVDSSQIFLHLPPRHFKSFFAAAKEAALSRFYAGIHYTPAIIEGEKVGRKIGEMTRKKFGKRY